MPNARFSLLFAGLLLLAVSPGVRGQNQSNETSSRPSTAAQRLADRYFQILLRRPSLGTALDKVYEYHEAADSLDVLIEELQQTEGLDEEQVGRQQFVVGLLHLKAGSADAAVSALQSAATALTDDALVSFHLAQALARTGNQDAATAAYQQAVDRNPPRTAAADIFLELGKRYQQKGDSEKADAIWAELAERFPGDQRIGERIARIESAAGDFAGAAVRFDELAASAKAAGDAEKAIEFSVESADLLNRSGKPQRALEAFQALLAETRPGSYLHNDLQRRIESSLREASDPAALLEYYEEQLSKSPDTIATRFRYAEALSSLARYEQAAEVYRETIDRAPSNIEARLGLIAVLRANGKVSEALDQYRSLAALDATNPDHLIHWGELALQDEATPVHERRARAAEIWKRLSSQRSDDPVALTQIAKRLRTIDRDEDAMQLYRDAIALAPDQPEYREYLGEYLFELNQRQEAIRVWMEIAADDRESLQTLVRLAEVFQSFGLAEQVVDIVTRASEHDPTFSHRLQFAGMLSDANEYDAAFEQLDLAADAAGDSKQEDRLLTVEIELLLRSGRLPTAIEKAEAADEQSATDGLALRRLALLQQAAGRWLPAFENIERAIALAPDNLRVLSTAATVFEEALRLEDAVGILLQLAELDRVSRFEHLTKAAQLQLRLGRVDEALATGQRRIDLNPSSAASHQAFAELCFAAARDEEAIEALRQAMRLDPRNKETRQRLASTLAEQYRTNEAIDLYWQAFEAATEFDDRLDLVGMLTPLHQRIGQLTSFVDQLTTVQLTSAGAGPSERALLIAAAHEAAGDIMVALDHLEKSSEGGSPQTSVLERVVQLALMVDDIDRATTHQRRLLEIDDSSGNRQRFLTLALRGENPQNRRDAVQRLCRAGEQSIVIDMIDDILRRGQFADAVELGDLFVPLAGARWEMPGLLRLAVANCGAGAWDRADELIGQIRERIAAKDVLLPVERDGQLVADASASSPRQTSLQVAPQLSTLLQFGDPAKCPIVEATSAASDVVDVQTPQQLEWFIDALALANAAKQQRLDAVYRQLATTTVQVSTDEGEANDAWAPLLRAQAYATFGGESLSQTDDAYETDWQRHLWDRVQKGDPAAVDSWLVWLRNRQSLRENAADSQQHLGQHQLTAVQLDWLETKLNETADSLSLDTHVAVYNELLRGDRKAAAGAYIAEVEGLERPRSVSEHLDAQQFFWEVGATGRARSLVPGLRQTLLENDSTLPADLFDRVMEQTVRCVGQEANPSARWEALQLLLTAEQRRMRQFPLVPSASESTESLMVYRDRGGESTLQNVTGPVSSRLVRPAFLESVYQLTMNVPGADATSPQRIVEQLNESLHQSGSSRPTTTRAKETDTARSQGSVAALPKIVAFFIQTWGKDWDAAEKTLASLQARFPDSPDLQLEQARLLETQGEREAAISVLAAMRPGDPQTLQKRDLRMLRLASYAAQPARASDAAERLSVMPLDTATQLTLVGQLKRMGLDELADGVLQRVRRQSLDDSSTLLEVADAYAKQGRLDAAVEAAFDVIRHDQRNAVPSPEMVRAVRLLHSLKQLDRLIVQLEQRAAAVGEPIHLLRQLSKIYQVAGLHDKMLAVEAKITEREPGNAKAQSELAAMYVTTHRYDAAVERFLVAFRNDPSLIAESWRDFERAVQMSHREDDALAGLLEIDVDRLPDTVVSQLSRFSLSSNRAPNGSMSQSKAAFYRRLLASQRPSEFVRNLSTVRQHAGAATAEIAATPLKKLFEDPATYAPDSPLWNQATGIKEGAITGGLAPILDSLNDDPTLRETIRDRLERTRMDVTARPMADVMLAAIEWESGEREQAHSRLRTQLQNPASHLAPALVWQLAQRWQSEAASDDAVHEMDQWLLSAPMPDAWKSFQHGIERRVLDRLLNRGRRDEALQLLRRGFLQQCPACVFIPRQSPERSATPIDAQVWEEVTFIARQMHQLQRPVEAIRMQRSLLRRLHPGRTDFRRQPILQQPALAVRKLTEEIDKIAIELTEAGPGTTEDALFEQLFFPQPPAPFVDLLVDVPEAWADRKVDSPMMDLFTSMAMQPQGQARLDAWRDGLSKDEVPDLALPMRLSLQALLSLRADSDGLNAILDTLVEAIETETDPPPLAVLQFVLVAEQASDSADPAVAAAGVKLASALVELAVDAGADHHLCHLVRMVLSARGPGDSDAQRELVLASLRRRLDQLAPPRQNPLTLDAETAAMALEFSELAVRAGDIQLSLDAAYRALAGGPPVFRSTSTSEVTGIDLGEGDLYRRGHAPQRTVAMSAASLADRWLALTETEQDGSPAGKIEETLGALVFPRRQSGQLHLYLAAATGTSFTFSSATPQPPNLLTPLARVAAQRGRLDELRRRVDSLNVPHGMIADVETAKMVFATESSDFAAARDAAERLVQHASLTLPSWQEVAHLQLPDAPFTSTFAKKKAAGRKLELADRLLLLSPAEDSVQQGHMEEESPASDWIRQRDQLLLRVIGMLLLDQETSRHSAPQIAWLARQIADRHPPEESAEIHTVARHLETTISAELDREER